MKKLLKFISRHFGRCLHPASAIEVFHFSHKGSDGKYLPDLICGYICTICMGKVDAPPCAGRGACPQEDPNADQALMLRHFVDHPGHVLIAFTSGFRDRFLSCHTCGVEFLVDDSDPKTGYHVRNFTRSAEIKRQLIAEGRETCS